MTQTPHLFPPGTPIPKDQHARLDAACRHLDAPVAVLDWHALSANAADLVQRAAGTPIRVASKSIRSTAVLRSLLATEGFAGILAFSLAEAIMLVTQGVSDDVVVAYPTTQRGALTQLFASPTLLSAITLMIDHPDHLECLRSIGTPAAPVRVCLDLDMSLRAGPVHIGTRRSPIHTVEQAVTAARLVTTTDSLRLVGLMGYEAQIAGVTDDTTAIRWMKKLSRAQVRARRQDLVHAVERVLCQRGQPSLEFVNGGGTGSLESTVTEDVVTEVAAGSGIYGPHLFDRYDDFTPAPAAFFGLDTVRHPAPGVVTVAGGGWIASGAPGPDRLPVPVYPTGLRYTRTEGAGEVQTPLRATNTVPAIGQRVWFRHTKAGELAEHVNAFHLLVGDNIRQAVTTYRGDGYAF